MTATLLMHTWITQFLNIWHTILWKPVKTCVSKLRIEDNHIRMTLCRWNQETTPVIRSQLETTFITVVCKQVSVHVLKYSTPFWVLFRKLGSWIIVKNDQWSSGCALLYHSTDIQPTEFSFGHKNYCSSQLISGNNIPFMAKGSS